MLGITLGVGIIVAVQLINDSALSSFSSSVDYLSGKASHSIVSSYGHIEESDFIKIWTNPHVKAAAPIVEVMAQTLQTGEATVKFIGIDPFLDSKFRSFMPSDGDEKSIDGFLAADPPGAYVSPSLLKTHGLLVGSDLTVLSAGIEKQVRIIGTLPPDPGDGSGDNTAVMDISSVQDIFGRAGYLDRIDIISTPDVKDSLPGLLQGLLLTTANSRKSTLQAMLYSFQLNLAAMSLIALFVGTFLIYNFSMFSVLSRREDLSLLLTLGADRKNLVLAFFLESILLAVAGSAMGVFFGYLIARLSIYKVSSTISELYFHVNVQSVSLTLPVVISGLAVGLAAVCIGTLMPALEVAVTPPVLGMKRRSIEDKAQSFKGLLLALSAAFFLTALLSAWASRFSVFWGFVSAFSMTLAFALCTPAFLYPFCYYMGSFLKKPVGSLVGFLAARNIVASLSRTSIAVAALAVALAMTIGVDGMIFSFRTSVSVWLEGALRGDLYISPSTTKWDHPLPDELAATLTKNPAVEGVERYSTYNISVGGKPAKLRVIDADVLSRYAKFTFLKGGFDPWSAIERGGIFASESLSFKTGLGVGDSVVLDTPSGKKSFPIVSIVRDYSSDQGTIQMDRAVFEDLWKDKRVQSIAIFLKPGFSSDDVRKWITGRFPGLNRTIASNVAMRENILAIFDKTFAPTSTLKGVSLLVALLGIATALMAILMERSRDMSVLGYLGLTPGELGRMNVFQATIMGIAAFLIAVVCGNVLTYIIVFAINYQSFGWSIDIFCDPWVLLKTFTLTILACLAASFYPTYRLMKVPETPWLKED
jgi:putative ABC transport system permease protein